MTGVADVYLMLSKPQSKEARQKFASLFKRKKKPQDLQKFAVLSWKRSGSNLLCGILHSHPEIIMHNELFNPIDIFTYYPNALMRDGSQEHKWNFLARDLWPQLFLEHIWPGKYVDGTRIKPRGKAVGFKSFPDHWKDANNEDVWKEDILDDFQVKKIILSRECELSTFVSMKRAEMTGCYLGREYPKDLKVHIGIPEFQAFVNHYRFTFQRKYHSPLHRQDTFRVTYEQLVDIEYFDHQVAPKLFAFLGVDNSFPVHRLKEIVKQSPDDERLEDVISNFNELEQAFRYSDVSYFTKRRDSNIFKRTLHTNSMSGNGHQSGRWSILLPICSRSASSVANMKGTGEIPLNHFAVIEDSAQHLVTNTELPEVCWKRLSEFAKSLEDTTQPEDWKHMECVVGIDLDDKVFNTDDARNKIRSILPCETIKFLSIPPKMYGKVCRIWNHLARHAKNEFIVLMGDDIVLLDEGWKESVEQRFVAIQSETGLPFGAACVAFNDITFKGFPTFPVIHRFHLDAHGFLLPRQFVNQGGDPFLYDLYSRFNASSFVSSRLQNTLGGDSSARYLKHDINWKGQVLTLSIRNLQSKLCTKPDGICIDIVIPSYRTNNRKILEKMVTIRAVTKFYVKFWIVVDNPDKNHLDEVNTIAREANTALNGMNYFVNVIHYGENRGASYARNTGYNYSTADWILFLDDDVEPDPSILDAYSGAILRYPNAKVMVGMTELPVPCNAWTAMLKTSNVMYFYGISKHRIHPPWGVTANLMVKGSRFNHRVQFNHIYPKTGGGEDIDFVFQMKSFYKTDGCVVGVPSAIARHPWWNNGAMCYKQISGWANGDSRVITQWPEKTYLVFPNWIESIALLVLAQCLYFRDAKYLASTVRACTCITIVDHVVKTISYFKSASEVTRAESKFSWTRSLLLALGASTVISSQEITRVGCIVKRCSLFCFGRRMDWFDGQAPTEVLDHQLRSGIKFILYSLFIYYQFVHYG